MLTNGFLEIPQCPAVWNIINPNDTEIHAAIIGATYDLSKIHKYIQYIYKAISKVLIIQNKLSAL